MYTKYEYYFDKLKHNIKNGIYMIAFKTLKYLDLFIDNKQYTIHPNYIYNIMILFNETTIVKFKDNFLQPIIVEYDFVFINVYPYENPVKNKYKNDIKYEIVYSFDKNYFCGAFASIYSLVYNFDCHKIINMNINIIISNNDVNCLVKHFSKCFFDELNINVTISLFVINYDLVIGDSFLNTKCLKGGNHLLNVGNFGRLLIGNLFDIDDVLYLDSDTIIQYDLSTALDCAKGKQYVICGKKSQLTYKNLLVSNNYHHTAKLFGDKFDINKNVIYTGTILIRPKLFKQYYNDFIKITEYHNSLSDGLYKLFTMSILNLCFWDKLEYFDDIINNIVDLGHIKMTDDIICTGHVLDWSGIYKPWFINGYYKKYWKKYNIFPCIEVIVENVKNSVEIKIKK